MAMILGIPWQWRPCYGKGNRALGYLLQELAGMETFGKMKEGLDKIIRRRTQLAKTRGMEEKPPDLDVDSLKKDLETLWNKIQDEESGYLKMVVSRKITLACSKWQPDNKDQASLAFLKYLLHLKAEEMITASGD